MAVLDRGQSSSKPTFNVFITGMGLELSRSGYIEYLKYVGGLSDPEASEIYDEVVFENKRRLVCKLPTAEAADRMCKSFRLKNIECEIT